MVRLQGWEKGLKLFRGEAPVAKTTLTLGDYLAEVVACGVIKPRTLRTYTTKVRTIAAFITRPKMPEMPDMVGSIGKSGKPKLTKTLSKFDYVNGGAAVWQQLVDATALHLLNSENVISWRKECLKPHEQNPRKLASATKTVNSCICAGKAIFATKVREKLPHVLLPDPVPFTTLNLLKETKNSRRIALTPPRQHKHDCCRLRRSPQQCNGWAGFLAITSNQASRIMRNMPEYLTISRHSPRRHTLAD